MDKRLKIVFWGEDSFSNIVLTSLIEAGHQLAMVVTPYYENLIYKRLELTCSKHNILFIRSKDINSEKIYKRLKEIDPDLCVVAHFERLIKRPLLSIPKMGFINLHPSLLPNYRGMSPQHWPIINGEKETGVTVHYVDEGIDTGDIIVQKTIPLIGNEYVSDLQKYWLKIYETIVLEAIDRILSGAETQKQKDLVGSYYGKLKPDQCMVDVHGGIERTYNLIRGVSMPYHGAQLENVIIWRAHKSNDNTLSLLHYSLGVHFNCNLLGSKKDLLILQDGYLIIDKYRLVERE